MMTTPWPALAGALLCTAAGFAGGYAFKARLAEGELAAIRAGHAAERQAAAEAAARRLAAAQAAADAALSENARRLLALDATNRRLRHDLKTVTSGRPCLSADARRLLHDAPAFRGGVSAPAGRALAAPAAPAADPASGDRDQGSGISTDADIAGWVLDAAGLYEACRARIEALRQWDVSTHGVRP